MKPPFVSASPSSAQMSALVKECLPGTLVRPLLLVAPRNSLFCRIEPLYLPARAPAKQQSNINRTSAEVLPKRRSDSSQTTWSAELPGWERVGLKFLVQVSSS